jgi:hypothetical protein
MAPLSFKDDPVHDMANHIGEEHDERVHNPLDQREYTMSPLARRETS